MQKAFYEKQISDYRIDNFINKLGQNIYTAVSQLQVTYAYSDEPIPYNKKDTLVYKPININEKWGELFGCAWFKFKGIIDKTTSDKTIDNLVAIVDLRGEGLVYDCNGQEVVGITTTHSEYDYSLGTPGKKVIPITTLIKGSEVEFSIDGACNDLFGKYHGGFLELANLSLCNNDIKSIYYDVWVLWDLAKVLDKDSARYSQIVVALNQVENILTDFNDNKKIKQCKDILNKELSKKSGDTGLTFYATGHAHMDLAWLWPIRETKRKALRTFATAITMLERYPDYIFGVSQPQQFLWVKQESPRLYEKLKQKVAQGRIELQGAMWCEPDLNTTSGEGLVRQIMYGKEFWKKEFSKDINIAHIPDVFGFSGALPQILKKSGVDYLTTIKMSWNKYNEFPYHTFNWSGIDGSTCLVHMPPEGTYNSAIAPRSIKKAEKQYKDKGLCEYAGLLYGIGDGGGGPGEEHLERAKRILNLNGISQVKNGTTEQLFNLLAKNSDNYKIYRGEMYLEKHQGTYTTQSKNKFFNRKSELGLRDLEFFATVASVLKGYKYPKAEIEELWQEVLLYQFHDILPGSSIKRVYDESVARYKVIQSRIKELILDAMSYFKSDKLYNPNCFLKTINGRTIEPYHGINTPVLDKNNIKFNDKNILQSKTLKVVFDDNGNILSIFDIALNCESLSGVSNLQRVYFDDGDAWDMGEQCFNKFDKVFVLTDCKVEYVNGKYIRRNILTYNQSTIIQTISIDDFSTIVRVDNQTTWQEKGKILRAEFLFNVVTDTVGCNCAYGVVERSTIKNNPYQIAQDEIPAHKYIDLSNGDKGVALINDCKYGHSVEKTNNGTLATISLLRSPNYPGIDADIGVHEYSYAIYSHKNALAISDVCEVAYDYNTELYNCDINGFIDYQYTGGAIIEAIKQSQDGSGVIIRIVEQKGIPSTASLKILFKHKSILLTTLDERQLTTITTEDISNLQLKPFEIITIKIII